MGYMRDLELELREMLGDLSEEKLNPVVKFVKQKVYESYKNGREDNGKKRKKKTAS